MILVGVLGAVVQAVCMATAPPRMQHTHPVVVLGTLLAGYERRVLGDGLFGLGVYRVGASLASDVRGLVALALLVVLLLAVGRGSGVRSIALPGLLLALSLALFAIPTVISGRIADGLVLDNIESSSRYYVAPVLMMLSALLMLLDRLVATPPARDGRWRAVGWHRVVPVVLGAVVVAATVTSFRLPEGYRDGARAWSTEVRRAAARCEAYPHEESAALEIAPVLWIALVPCDRLRPSG